MPMSSPLTSMPMLRALCSGREHCAAMGINICGMTEQIPVSNEAPSRAGSEADSPMASSATTRILKLTTTM